MAVIGMEAFKRSFEGYEDCYTIIGGTACDILMSEAQLDFRATKDIDMIILLEDRYQKFAQKFWSGGRVKGQYAGHRRVRLAQTN